MGAVVCHTLLLFGKSPLSIMSFDFLYNSLTRALPLLSFPVLSAFTLIPSTISHLWNQSGHVRIGQVRTELQMMNSLLDNCHTTMQLMV